MTQGFIAIALVIAYAGFSGFWVQNSGDWYDSLKRPSWQPPDVVFGLIWPYNFLMLAVVGWQVVQNSAFGNLWLGSFALSVALATAWSYLFYKRHCLKASALSLSAAALWTIPMTVVTWEYSPVMGFFFTPYQIWLATAASLALGYAALNRQN